MQSKFAAFASALDALCRQHHVALHVFDRSVAVYYINGRENPIRGLVDQTGAASAGPTVPQKPRSIPDRFETALAAKEFPGFLGYETGRPQAAVLAEANPGSFVVPIGTGGRFIRGWAVIKA